MTKLLKIKKIGNKEACDAFIASITHEYITRRR